ncbi:MAG: hypothetical protein GF393_09575 [Armatimonadia bacterium]|nr:hypothetical protein [Armatimonadia bacterium]
MRKRPEIPEDVFFDTGPAQPDAPADDPAPESEPPAQRDEEPADDLLAKSMADADGGTPITPSEAVAEAERGLEEQRKRRGGDEEGSARVGRPPAQEGPKVAVTLYLTEPVAHLLEEVKFRLLTEYDVKTSKSAIADFAMRNGLDDLQAAADDLRRE